MKNKEEKIMAIKQNKPEMNIKMYFYHNPQIDPNQYESPHILKLL